LRDYRTADYEVVSVRDYVKRRPKRALVMRHDLDIAMDRALNLSAVELEQGCTATYLVRLHSRYYNPFSYDGTRTLRALLDAGHEIGFHFEPGMPELMNVPVEKYLAHIRVFFSNLLNTPITVLSQHYAATFRTQLPPACWLDHWHDVTEDGLNGDGKYLSDSGGRWREGCFCQWVGKADKLFVLTHPLWWYDKMPQECF